MSAVLAAQAVAPTGARGEDAKAFVYILVALLVIVVAAIVVKKFFGGIDGLLEMLNLKDTAEEKALKAAIDKATESTASQSSPWNANFYKTAPQGTKLITDAFAKQLAQQMYDSVGNIYDTPAKGLAAIKQCPNQASVSKLSDVFSREHKRDLYGWLENKYDRTEQMIILKQIIDYVANLKKYI